MRKALCIGVIALFVMTPFLAFAAEFRAGDQPSVRSSETISGDVYMGGGNVTSSGTINGDLLAGGGTITVSGKVSGDIAAGGGTITITSEVTDDIRAGGGNITLQGRVGGDVVAGGGTVHIGGPGVGGDVVVGGGSIRVDAPVSGKIMVGGGDVYLNSTINGNVEVDADKLTLGSGAVLNGNLTYSSGREVITENGATVKGQTVFNKRQDVHKDRQAVAAIVSGFILWKLAALLVAALVVGLAFRRYAREITERVVNNTWSELGRGVAVLILMPITSVILLVTVVGIPLGIIGLLTFVVTMMVMWILSPIVLGSILSRYFFKHESHRITWQTILLGAIVFSIIDLIPFIGGLFNFALMLTVLGAALRLKWSIARDWR